MQSKNNETKGLTQSIVIPFDLREKVVKIARERNQSISSFICQAIEGKLRGEKGKANAEAEKKA